MIVVTLTRKGSEKVCFSLVKPRPFGSTADESLEVAGLQWVGQGGDVVVSHICTQEDFERNDPNFCDHGKDMDFPCSECACCSSHSDHDREPTTDGWF